MILIYRILSTLLYPLLFIFVYYRKIINKEDKIRYKEKILISHFKVIKKKKSKLIWFHAASIGEFKSIIPIIKQLNYYRKNLKFLITTNTLSSGNVVKLELGKIKNIEHRYFPLDVPFLIEKFFQLWKPDKLFLVDSEIWPNLVLAAKKNKTPIALINARLTSKSFRRWMIFSKATKEIFSIFSLFICSNKETKSYFKKLNLENVYFNGNLKFAGNFEIKKIKNINKGILIKKKFWFAASIHKEEDLMCLKTHLKLKEKFKNITTIIAPRHTYNSKRIKLLSERLNLKAQILNRDDKIMRDNEIIIINYFGALTSYFKYVKSTFIGKSMILKLKSQGGQNPIEAAKSGCKIYHGPYVYNFKDVYKFLEKNKISKKIYNFKDLSKNLTFDFKYPQKQNLKNKYLINKIGKKTMADTMIHINNFLDDKKD